MKDKSVILVVDDQLQNIELLEAYLVPQGYEVIKAASGKEALEKIVHNQIDLILLDIMMPKMSGLELLEKLRADEKTEAIPVVMVTALKETEDKIKALEAGCDDFISKPVDKIELLARVKSILKISYYLRQLDEKEKFKAVVDKISDGIAICSPDYLIKDSNTAILKYLNITDPANVNLVETLFRNYSVSINKEALMDLTIAHKTFDIVRQESETIEALYLEANSDLIKNSAGELLSIVFIFRDVTAARMEEFLKQDTLTLISHKLRTPLGVISGKISLLQDGSYGHLNEEQKKAIDTVSKQSSLLISTVEELLGFTIVCSHPSFA
ncbi:MAG: response regulator [Candidatus Omnitrophica bacterium]|nr:response regulator [Candidatus Omnitrophota bacterium]